MITSMFASRRAERFAQLLDEAAGARRQHIRSTADSDLAELVGMSQRVSTLPLVVQVDPEFRTGLRASLMARIEREGIGITATDTETDAPATGRRRTHSRARAAIVVTVAASGFAAFGVSAASGDAIPGDTLYGVKRQTERARVAFAGSQVSRGQLHFEFAKVRLAEAGALGSDLTRLDPVLDDMDADTRNGSRLLTMSAVERGDKAGLEAVQQFVGEQRPTMRNLVNRLTGPAKTRAADSLALLDRIGVRAGKLKNTVGCESEVPVDEIGAVPVHCSHASPGQQPGREGAPGAEAAPQPGASRTSGPAAEPVGTAPSVEAGSSSAPGGTNGLNDAEDGIMETIENVFDKVFGG